MQGDAYEYAFVRIGVRSAIAWRDRSRAEIPKIADPADREVIEGDLATLPL